MSQLSGGFRPQAALASPAIRARTTGSRGREKDRFAVCGFRFSVFKFNEGEVDYCLVKLNIISRQGAKAPRRKKDGKLAKIRDSFWRIIQRAVSFDKLSFAASGRTGTPLFP